MVKTRASSSSKPTTKSLKSPDKVSKGGAAVKLPKVPQTKVLKSPEKVGKVSAAAAKVPQGQGQWRFNSLGVPQCPLPSRESQFEEIWTFLHENVSEKHSRCMYVSGVPGTGKTVIVQSVVETLERYANERKQHLQFNNVYINGLSLGSPDKIWKRLICGIKNVKEKLTPQVALKKLETYFETKTSQRPTVLVIDELDQILDKKQSILYQLLEWAAHDSTMFTLIAIFNTMSLPESGLAMRNVSRIGLIRCIFPPYTYEQLDAIVKNSLAGAKSERIKDNAISFLSKKVAAVSGDARRALELAKRAVEIVESGQATGVLAVDCAFKEIFSSPKIEAMKDCSYLEQLFLKTLSSELQHTGNEETVLLTVYNNLSATAAYEAVVMNWSVDQVLKAAMRLYMMKLIILENTSGSLHKRLSLNVPFEDINFALGIRSVESEP